MTICRQGETVPIAFVLRAEANLIERYNIPMPTRLVWIFLGRCQLGMTNKWRDVNICWWAATHIQLIEMDDLYFKFQVNLTKIKINLFLRWTKMSCLWMKNHKMSKAKTHWQQKKRWMMVMIHHRSSAPRP